MIIDYSKLFQQPQSGVPMSRATVEVQKNVARQFSALTYEINKRNRVNKKTVTMITPEAPLEDKPPTTKMVSWKSLDMCEKYKLLKAFMDDNKVEKKEAAELIQALKRGTIEIEYDKSNKSVTKAALPASALQVVSVG